MKRFKVTYTAGSFIDSLFNSDTDGVRYFKTYVQSTKFAWNKSMEGSNVAIYKKVGSKWVFQQGF